jgi:hypothetical protein
MASDQPNQSEKFTEVNLQLKEVVGIMSTNLELVIEREHKLNDLQESTEILEKDARSFRNRSSQLKRKLWYMSTNLTIAYVSMAMVVIITIILIIFSAAGGFNKN